MNNINFSELELSTITVEGGLSNIQFDLQETIDYILYNIVNPIKNINNINKDNIIKLKTIKNKEFIPYLNNILNNDFYLYDIIIKELYNQDSVDKNIINIGKLLVEYSIYNNTSLTDVKKYCKNINNLLETLFTITIQLSDKNDIAYSSSIDITENDINILTINYLELYNILNNNILIKQYIELNNIIEFNYSDIKLIHDLISHIDTKLLEDIINNIKTSNNIKDIVKDYCNNYEVFINNISNIKKIYNEYSINKKQYYNNIIDYNSKLKNCDYDFSIITKNIIDILSNNKKEYELFNNFIIKIGCNYGEYISEKYKELTKKPVKSNRGRKPKIKTKSNRRKQGTGKYFTSQITFTILSDGINDDINKLYHIKIFVNGVIQIPSVTNENIDIMIPYLKKIISYFNNKVRIIIDNKKEDIEILPLKSIMRNYKFYSFNEYNINYNIKLHKFKTLLLQQKNDINDKKLDYCIFPITEIKYSIERYPAMLIKFDISKETGMANKKNKKPKRITVKIFSSTKINIDGSNTVYSARKIQQFLLDFINQNKKELLYNYSDYE